MVKRKSRQKNRTLAPGKSEVLFNSNHPKELAGIIVARSLDEIKKKEG